MERKLVLGFAGAVALALAAVGGTAMAAAIPDLATQTCSDKLQNETLKYVNAVQKQIRLSVKNNIKAHDSKCSGGLACSGGANNGKTCTSNAFCGSGGLPPTPFECTVNAAKGIAGAINKAKGSLRGKINTSCTDGQLATLGFPNSRCPVATTRSKLADCILQGAVGDVSTAVFGDVAGEVLGRAATDVVPQATNPISVCGVTLASVLSIGSESTSATIAESGGAAPLLIPSCVGTVCNTKGTGVVGNSLTPPTQTFAGLIPVCLVTKTKNAGNGTSQIGLIDLGTGEQHSFSPIESTVLIGTVCPLCNETTHTCDTGPHAGLGCTAAGGTDTACPPTIAGTPPLVPNPLDLDTEANTLSVLPSGGDVTNPSGTFCGACDLDTTIGCQHDADCTAALACSGAGCCNYGTNTGAFGVDSATSATANGLRGPIMPKLATIFCTGQSGDGLVDSTQGLPGPVRLVQQQLNAFEYAP